MGTFHVFVYVISSISPDRTSFWQVTEGPLVPTYEPLGNSTVYEFWCWYLKKRFVHISAQRAPYSGTMPGHQGWTLLMPLENYPTHYQNEHFWMVTLTFVLSYVQINPFGFVNPLSHKIHIQIVQTNLHTFSFKNSWESFRSKHCPFGNQFSNSHSLYSCWSADVVRRKLMLVVLGRVHVSTITAFRNVVYIVHVISRFTGK